MSKKPSKKKVPRPYKFKIAVGDWSGDGHGKCEYFLITSNKPMEKVREAFFAAVKKTKLDLGEVCDKYEQSELTPKQVEKLTALNYDMSLIEETYKGVRIYYLDTEKMRDLVIWFLEQGDPSLSLGTKVDEVPLLQFYGGDRKGRHISGFGYGLFY